jgi:hypothetical protein
MTKSIKIILNILGVLLHESIVSHEPVGRTVYELVLLLAIYPCFWSKAWNLRWPLECTNLITHIRVSNQIEPVLLRKEILCFTGVGTPFCDFAIRCNLAYVVGSLSSISTTPRISNFHGYPLRICISGIASNPKLRSRPSTQNRKRGG